jgi:hypothetical protein
VARCPCCGPYCVKSLVLSLVGVSVLFFVFFLSCMHICILISSSVCCLFFRIFDVQLFRCLFCIFSVICRLPLFFCFVLTTRSSRIPCRLFPANTIMRVTSGTVSDQTHTQSTFRTVSSQNKSACHFPYRFQPNQKYMPLFVPFPAKTKVLATPTSATNTSSWQQTHRRERHCRYRSE